MPQGGGSGRRIVEFGLAFKDQLAITSAVRAGARMASAEPRQSTFASDAAAQVAQSNGSIDMTKVTALWVYRADATGHPMGAGGSFSSCATDCIKFTWNGTGFTQASGSWSLQDQDSCQGEQVSVGVYLQFTHVGATTVIFSTLGLNSYTVMRFEPIPALQAGGCK